MLRLRLILVLFALVLAGLGATTTHAATKRHHDNDSHNNNNNNNNNNHHHRPAGKQVVRYARKFLGIRYSWGGISPRTGFDCSGLVSFVYHHFGVSLPHYTGAQLYRGRHVPRRRLRPGDLLFFGVGHVGLYAGHGRFIHAPHTGTRVRIERLRRWDVTDARRVV
jgi:peptidoglycan DL-endopeptidase CwlO